MKFLADENFPGSSISLLLEKGFHVLNIAKEKPGITDLEVFKLAQGNSLIILTFDKDFGHIVFQEEIKNSGGIVFFRLKSFQELEPAHILLKLIDDSFEFYKCFTVIEKDKVRQRKIS